MLNDLQMPIAIVGLDARVPGANNVAELWDLLEDDRETIGQPVEHIASFDYNFFGYSKAEAAMIDPQQRVLLECAYHALFDSGYLLKSEVERAEQTVGVFCGVGFNQYLHSHLLPFFLKQKRSSMSPHLLHASSCDYASMRIAYQLNLKGPVMGVQSACSTGLVAAHQACINLATNQCDIALVGACALLLQENADGAEIDGMLSKDGRCCPFAADATGTIFSSGAGMIVLKRLSDAAQSNDKIYAIIRGSAVNNDGSEKLAFSAPSPAAQTAVIQKALNTSGVDPRQISYIETHGTGTPLGDYIEFCALEAAFKPYIDDMRCCIGSLKSNIGHTLQAAGILSLIKVALAMNARQIPASLHCESMNPRIHANPGKLSVNTHLLDWDAFSLNDILFAGISSFGIGGTNAHMVVESASSRVDVSNSFGDPEHFNRSYCWIEAPVEIGQGEQEADLKIVGHGMRASLAETMRECWIELLGVSSISDSDDFFDLGGHSLLATQIISKITAGFNVQLEINDFYNHPTFGELIVYLLK